MEKAFLLLVLRRLALACTATRSFEERSAPDYGGRSIAEYKITRQVERKRTGSRQLRLGECGNVCSGGLYPEQLVGVEFLLVDLRDGD